MFLTNKWIFTSGKQFINNLPCIELNASCNYLRKKFAVYYGHGDQTSNSSSHWEFESTSLKLEEFMPLSCSWNLVCTGPLKRSAGTEFHFWRSFHNACLSSIAQIVLSSVLLWVRWRWIFFLEQEVLLKKWRLRDLNSGPHSLKATPPTTRPPPQHLLVVRIF